MGQSTLSVLLLLPGESPMQCGVSEIATRTGQTEKISFLIILHLFLFEVPNKLSLLLFAEYFIKNVTNMLHLRKDSGKWKMPITFSTMFLRQMLMKMSPFFHRKWKILTMWAIFRETFHVQKKATFQWKKILRKFWPSLNTTQFFCTAAVISVPLVTGLALTENGVHSVSCAVCMCCLFLSTLAEIFSKIPSS